MTRIAGGCPVAAGGRILDPTRERSCLGALERWSHSREAEAALLLSSHGTVLIGTAVQQSMLNAPTQRAFR
jgi:hypothetical protein